MRLHPELFFRFAQFFLRPRLDELTCQEIETAIEDLESEFTEDMGQDENRIPMVETSFCKKNHPFSRLITG